MNSPKGEQQNARYLIYRAHRTDSQPERAKGKLGENCAIKASGIVRGAEIDKTNPAGAISGIRADETPNWMGEAGRGLDAIGDSGCAEESEHQAAGGSAGQRKW